MTGRMFLAGVLGGVTLFAWQSISHLLLPLGDAGIKGLSNERPVLAALAQNIKEPGFYFFPAPEEKPGMTWSENQEAMAKAMEKYRTGPHGILIFTPRAETRFRPSNCSFNWVLALWLAAVLGPRPLSAKVVALTGLGGWLFVPWGCWIDRHRRGC